MLYVAAFLIVVLGIGHLFLGEREVLIPLARREHLLTPSGSKEFSPHIPRVVPVLRIVWHLLSLAYFAFAVLLLLIAANRFGTVNTAQIVGGLFIASGVPPLVLTRGRDWSAWVEFFLIGGLVLAWNFF